MCCAIDSSHTHVCAPAEKPRLLLLSCFFLQRLMLLFLLMFCSCFHPVFIMHELVCGPVIILKVLALQHQAQRLGREGRRHNLSSHLSVTGPQKWRIKLDKDGFELFWVFQFRSPPVCTLAFLFSAEELRSKDWLMTFLLSFCLFLSFGDNACRSV